MRIFYGVHILSISRLSAFQAPTLHRCHGVSINRNIDYFFNSLCRLTTNKTSNFCMNDPLPMMTSSNGNIFRVTGPLCGEFTGDRWIPTTKASDAELWCFFYLHLNKRLSKQSWGWWFETLSRPLWRRCNVRGIHRWAVASHHKWPVIPKAFPHHDVIV